MKTELRTSEDQARQQLSKEGGQRSAMIGATPGPNLSKKLQVPVQSKGVRLWLSARSLMH